ncbi:MAG: IS5/IS1182 family transposase, partial [Bacteroidaceae bacterium]|nr:IS5/IS1182 family transposase [Bacteroidaceae bacterium]
MIKTQKKLLLSPYAELYDILVPANHFLRRMHDDIDFSFIYDELVGKYSQDMGRTAYDPVMMFKYLILK